MLCLPSAVVLFKTLVFFYILASDTEQSKKCDALTGNIIRLNLKCFSKDTI